MCAWWVCSILQSRPASQTRQSQQSSGVAAHDLLQIGLAQARLVHVVDPNVDGSGLVIYERALPGYTAPGQMMRRRVSY